MRTIIAIFIALLLTFPTIIIPSDCSDVDTSDYSDCITAPAQDSHLMPAGRHQPQTTHARNILPRHDYKPVDIPPALKIARPEIKRHGIPGDIHPPRIRPPVTANTPF